MKTRAFNALLFLGLTAWAAVAHWQLVPGFACMALGQACYLLFLVEALQGRARTELLWGFLALTYLGLAWLIAALFGGPTSLSFWSVFGAAAVVFAPVVLLARRVFPRG